MKPEDIQGVAEALATALAPMFTQITEALKPAVVEEVVVEDEVDQTEVLEAIVAAELPKTGRGRVLEAVKNGTAFADAITAEKAYVAEVLKESAVTVGKVTESGNGSGNFTVGGWN